MHMPGDKNVGRSLPSDDGTAPGQSSSKASQCQLQGMQTSSGQCRHMEHSRCHRAQANRVLKSPQLKTACRSSTQILKIKSCKCCVQDPQSMKAHMLTTSPDLMVPSRTLSSSTRGIEAAEVLP